MTRRTEQIVSLWESGSADSTELEKINLLHASQAPEQNDRFLGIWRENGELVYRSGQPSDGSFDPAAIPLHKGNGGEGKEAILRLSSPDMIISCRPFGSHGMRYIAEAGMSRRSLLGVMNSYRNMLLGGIAGVVILTVLGGMILVKLSLRPLDRMIRTARGITVQNLSSRLPVEETGDELQQLSLVLNEMIARLEESFAHSQRFCAHASHELRTPLTIILGEIEGMMAPGGGVPEKIRENLSSIYVEAEHLKRIVEALFSIARLDAGGASFERKLVDLSELAGMTSEQMALLAQDKNITVHTDLGKRIEVLGDQVRLKQVIVNLLDNAIKFTPAGGIINLTTRLEGETARLDILDSGPGIPETSLPHAFESFFRAREEWVQRTDGAGIGLSIVKSICEAHRGSATISNKKEGGCIVTIRIPIAPEKNF